MRKVGKETVVQFKSAAVPVEGYMKIEHVFIVLRLLQLN